MNGIVWMCNTSVAHQLCYFLSVDVSITLNRSGLEDPQKTNADGMCMTTPNIFSKRKKLYVCRAIYKSLAALSLVQETELPFP